ncbi:N,N-dimethylaniline monooxygenase [Aureococcus anophagefferens]|nr:N,N-dimethylaniline monooxygenase [Aureococcus anophagefferens]
MPLRILTAIALLSAAHQGIQVAASSSNLGAPSSDVEAAASLKDRFLRSSASAQDLVKSKEPVQLDDISHGQESLVALSGDSSSSDVEAAASLKGRFLRSSASAQDLVKSKEPVQLDDISHGQESLVALSGDSPSSDVEAAASLKDRFFRSSASAQDLVKSKEPVQLDDISHGQESLVALSGDSSSSDVEAAASLKGRFFRSSASAQDLVKSKEPVQLDDISHGQESLDLVKSKEPVQLDDISHGQESLVALSGDSPSSDVEAAASLKDRFFRSSASAQDLVKSKEPVQLDDISHGQESLVANSGDSPSSDAEAAASLKGFLRSSASAQDLLAAKEPAQLDDISHGQESLVALSGDSPSSDAEAAASLKGRFLRSSASAQDLLAAKEPAQLDKVAHAQESLFAASVAGGDSSSSEVEATASLKDRFLRSSASAQDLVKSKEPVQLDDISHGQESLVALSGDSSSSDVEAAASLKGRFLRSSASAQDLLAAKEPAQLDDISHGQESLVALSGDSSSSDVEAAASLKDRFLRSSASAQGLLAAKEPVQLDDISHGQESLVALSGDSPSSDAEAAASLKGRFLRSSASAQDLLAAKEPAQLDDISHGQESLVALSGDSSSSDVEAAASLKDRFLRSSASAQGLLAAKEPAQLDDISHGQESLVALSGDSSSSDDLVKSKEPVQLDDISHGQESLVALSGDSSSSDVEAAASLKDRFLRSSASAQGLLAAKEPAQFDDGLFGKTRLPLAARKYLRDDSNKQSSILSAAHQGTKVTASSSNLGAPSSKTAVIPKKRFLRSSASAQDLVKSKEPVQFDKVAHAQESLFAASAAGGDSSSSEIEAAASLAPEADVRRLSDSCPDTAGSRTFSWSDLRDSANYAYKNQPSMGWKRLELIEETIEKTYDFMEKTAPAASQNNIAHIK